MSGLAGSAAPREGIWRRVARLDDGALMRGAFYGLAAMVAVVLAVDYRDLSAATPSAQAAPDGPVVLPAVLTPDGEPGDRPEIDSDPETLRRPMRIELAPGGVLKLSGAIVPGTAERFSGEIGRIGEYVTTVELESPGGSVADALAMSALIRQKGYRTHVGAGRLCASSCPLLLAGGTVRSADAGAAVGIHQVFTASPDPVEPKAAVSNAQSVTASVTRHLTGMGVDPALWLHALDTPPERLYFLTREEMQRYRLTGGRKG